MMILCPGQPVAFYDPKILHHRGLDGGVVFVLVLGGAFVLVFHINKSMIGSGDAIEVRGVGMGAGAGGAGGGARRRERDRAKKKGGVGMFLPFFLMLMLAASFPIFMGVWAPEAKSHLIDRVKNWRKWKEGASSSGSVGAPVVGASGAGLPEHVVSRIEDLAKKNEELSRRLEQMEKAQLGSGREVAVGGGSAAGAPTASSSSIRTEAGQGGGAAAFVAGDVSDDELMKLAMAAAGGTVCIPASLSHTREIICPLSLCKTLVPLGLLLCQYPRPISFDPSSIRGASF